LPELPEVETVRRGLEATLVGARIDAVELRRPDLRFPFPEDFVERLTGRRIVALGRRAKYLLADLDDGTVLVMHLGMSGSFRIGAEIPGNFVHPRDASAAHDHVVFHLSNGSTVTYNDPRRFGFMLLVARHEMGEHPLFRDIGVEPLGNELDGALLATLLAGKKTSLKSALLDQTVIAGLGNIYVSEALHRAGLSPRRRAGTLAVKSPLARQRADRLAEAIREVLQEAVEAGGSSLRDHRRPDGSLGYFQHNFKVYGREGEPCPTPGCGGTIRRITQAGRSTFYCPKCQT
jgi:formamidopyrimidine-DNA glycosylase